MVYILACINSVLIDNM